MLDVILLEPFQVFVTIGDFLWRINQGKHADAVLLAWLYSRAAASGGVARLVGRLAGQIYRSRQNVTRTSYPNLALRVGD